MAEELKKLTSRVKRVKGGKGIEGLNYEDLCIQPDVELQEGYKPPKFEMFDGIGDPKVHLRNYCDKLVGVRKDERIRIKLFMRSLTGDALSWERIEEEVDPPAATPISFEVEVATPFTVTVSTTPPFNSKVIPWDYVAEARRKGKAKMEESDATQGMTRTGRVYTPEHLGGSSKEATTKQPVIEIGPDDFWRKVLNEAYVPNNITCREMANMVGQSPDRWRLKPQYLPLDTLKRLGKGFHEIQAGIMNVKAFDGSQRATIGEINLCLQMGPT
ncbi:uncharacterized protein [Nicotiana sylvestris]|uniref:uncharacterized protein n=1 Tax=Nicotiana sylvestris TaxID=4096 RepID=UPI00388C8A49